ncbi:MAG: MT-A70 family methyltransferase [Thermotogota bacterium]|nr:MT-A70 family methyltransferase [Thermotogota bacterium]
MEFHEIADIFPMMEEKELMLLAEDIKENGLFESIYLYDGKILDGRNRYKACKKAGVEPKFERYAKNDPLGFVISLNLKRRHLNESQRSMIAARVANMRQGERTDLIPNGIKLSQPEAAEKLNVSIHSISRAQQILNTEDEDLIKQIDTGKKKVSVMSRELKRKADSKAIQNKTFPVIEGKFKTILIDPPWDYKAISLAGRGHPEYSTLSIEELTKLNIGQYAETDCHLYLWATNNFLYEALKLGVGWGFSYKTVLTWVKPSMGMGSYFRNNTEQLLFFVKGALQTRTNNTLTHFESPRGKHSAKPEISYQIIEANSYPAYLEYFGRKERENWEVFGNV